jgi:hypothetical protein
MLYQTPDTKMGAEAPILKLSIRLKVRVQKLC